MGKISDALEKSMKVNGKGDGVGQTLIDSKIKKENVLSINSEFSLHTVNQYDPHLITYHNTNSVEADAFKILRMNILHTKDGSSPRTILVTSAIPGEGKTFVSTNLSISIAQGLDEHVLLMDCDMYKLDMIERFGLKDRLGLSDYLTKEIPLDQLLIKTSINKLTLLPGGKRRQNPTELLSSRKMADLIDEVKNRYPNRYIVLDSPPPAVAAETIAISKQVDGILFVVKEKGASRKIIKETIEMIDKEKIIGVVFNWSKRRRNKYFYGYNKYGDKSK